MQSITITSNGLQHDRTFMLIRVLPDGTISNMTIKETSQVSPSLTACLYYLC